MGTINDHRSTRAFIIKLLFKNNCNKMAILIFILKNINFNRKRQLIIRAKLKILNKTLIFTYFAKFSKCRIFMQKIYSELCG